MFNGSVESYSGSQAENSRFTYLGELNGSNHGLKARNCIFRTRNQETYEKLKEQVSGRNEVHLYDECGTIIKKRNPLLYFLKP